MNLELITTQEVCEAVGVDKITGLSGDVGMPGSGSG